MNQNEIDAAVNLIKASLESRTDKRVTGALLGELIRKVTPELNVRELDSSGKGTLTKFVDEYFKGFLFRIGKKGSDFLYRIGEPDSDTDATINYDYWRAFVRPNSKVKISLVGNPFDFVLAQNGDFLEDSLHIKSVTPQELDEVRRGFIKSLSVTGESDDLPAMELPYPEWSQSLKSCNIAKYKAWTAFRIQQLLEVFSHRLLELNVPEERQAYLLKVMKQSQASLTAKESRPRAKAESVIKVEASARAPHAELSSDNELRDIIIQAVNNMSISDLRELKLPVGTLLDAFFSKLQK